MAVTRLCDATRKLAAPSTQCPVDEGSTVSRHRYCFALATEKCHNRVREDIIAIARHHMSGMSDVNKLSVGNVLLESPHGIGIDKFTLLAANEQSGNGQVASRNFKPIWASAAFGSIVAGDEAWIPMPIVATILLEAQIFLQAGQIFRAGAVGQVPCNRVGRFFKRCET